MRHYLRFLLIGLVLGLLTEAELKLVAGVKPEAFPITLAAYPVIVTLFYGLSRLLDRTVPSVWIGDLLHYAATGIGGLAIEWTLLGNGPGSNALQIGMFAMWTTFGFGPRVLARNAAQRAPGRRRFWIAFAVAAVLITAAILLAGTPQAKLLTAVFGLSGTNALWSLWLLALAWTARNRATGLKPTRI